MRGEAGVVEGKITVMTWILTVTMIFLNHAHVCSNEKVILFLFVDEEEKDHFDDTLATNVLLEITDTKLL